LIAPDGKSYIAIPGKEIEPVSAGDPRLGELDAKGIPATLEG
jgi:hypothetical protein